MQTEDAKTCCCKKQLTVPSTVIDKIDYDKQRQLLRISYVSGQTYQYRDVPEQVYKELKASRVKGRYLKFFVKDKYAYEKVNP